MVALSVAGCSNHLALDSDDEPFAVYLDMNHCYALGRASAGEPERPSDPEVLERLRMLRRDGRVVVPLSAIHYSELRENPRDRFTAEAGAVMEELSDFWTLAPMSTVFAEEFDAQLKARFGRPAVVRTSPKIGRGVGFAHGMPGSFGLDASPAAAEALRRRLGEDGIRQLEASANKAFEHFALQGGRRVPGFNPYEDRDRAEARLARVLRVVENLCLDPSLYRRLEDVVVAGEFIAEMFEDFLGALVYADSDPYRIATELTDSKEKMTELVGAENLIRPAQAADDILGTHKSPRIAQHARAVAVANGGPVQAGVFGGSVDRFVAAADQFDSAFHDFAQRTHFQ